MSFIYCDGFDDYANNTNMSMWWNSAVTGSLSWQQTSLNGVSGYSFSINGNNNTAALRLLGAQYTSAVLGFRFNSFSNIASGANVFGAYLYDSVGAGPQIGLGYDTSGAVHVYRGAYGKNADLGTIPGFTMAINQSYYFEIKVTMATTATGSVTVHVNGGTAAGGYTFTASNVQTAQTAHAYYDSLALGCGGNGYIDDLYLFDTTGTTNNDFVGDVRVETRYAAAAGRLTQWPTQVGGTGGQPWTAVNENNPDGDTSYLADSTAGDIEMFTLSAGSGSVSAVYAAQVTAIMRKDDVSAHVLASGVGNGTTESWDSGTSCNTSYGADINALDKNPLTSANWSPSDLATLQIGVKVVS